MFPTVSSGLRAFDLLLFSQELVALLSAGLNLTEALQTLLAKSSGQEQQVLQTLSLRLSHGQRLSQILGDLPQFFPPVFVASVHASERSGHLERALLRYISYQKQVDDLRKKLRAALLYPCFLLVVSGVVTFFLITFVVPRFASIYEGTGKDLPWASSALLWLGQGMSAHMGLVIFFFIAMAFGFYSAWRNPIRRERALELLLANRWVAPYARLFRLSRFYRALSLLLESGVSLPKALEMVGGLLSTAQRLTLQEARQRIERGESVGHVLHETGLATVVAQSLIRVGERSGQLGAMLEKTAQFHDEELARVLDSASRLLEPVLMLIIGLVIGGVVVLMYLPIFELAGGIG